MKGGGMTPQYNMKQLREALPNITGIYQGEIVTVQVRGRANKRATLRFPQGETM